MLKRNILLHIVPIRDIKHINQYAALNVMYRTRLPELVYIGKARVNHKSSLLLNSPISPSPQASVPRGSPPMRYSGGTSTIVCKAPPPPPPPPPHHHHHIHLEGWKAISESQGSKCLVCVCVAQPPLKHIGARRHFGSRSPTDRLQHKRSHGPRTWQDEGQIKRKVQIAQKNSFKSTL